MARITFFIYLFILNYSRVCVLDPAVAHCSSCTNWIKPLGYNKSRVNKWKAVCGSNSSKIIFQWDNTASVFTYTPRTVAPLAFLCGAPYPSNPCSTRPAPASCWHWAELGRLGASLPCSRWRISKRCHNISRSSFSNMKTIKVGSIFQYSQLLLLRLWLVSAWIEIQSITFIRPHAKRLLLGHRLEIQKALVLCDGCHLLFYLTHKSHRVSVQGNEVCSGVQQSLKVGRTTVLAFVGVGYLPFSDPPSGVWTVVCVDTNLKRIAKIIEMLSPLPPPSFPPWCVRLSVALCASEHDPLWVSAASLRPQRWQLANGRWLHQQPARQVEVVLFPYPIPPPPPSTHSMSTKLLFRKGGGRWSEAWGWLLSGVLIKLFMQLGKYKHEFVLMLMEGSPVVVEECAEFSPSEYWAGTNY